MLQRRQRKITAAAVLLIAAAVFVLLFTKIHGQSREYLVLRNGQTGEVYAKYEVAENDEFSVAFVHSVNKRPYIDAYQIKDRRIYVERTIYYQFGAGVQTELEKGQSLVYGDNGEMIVSGFHTEMTNLSYLVGTVSDHVLTIHGQEISLREMCGRNAMVVFRCE